MKAMHKKLTRSMFAVLLAVLMLTAVPTVSAASFSDVSQKNPHYSAVVKLADQGAIQGYVDGSFGVWDPINRQQAAQIFTKLLKLKVPANPDAVLAGYQDVSPEDDTFHAIAAAVQAGLLKGDGVNFDPGKEMTREQLATVLVRALKLDKVQIGKHVNINLRNVSSLHKKQVQILADLGITTSLKDYQPQQPITRGVFATMVVRAQEAAARAKPQTKPVASTTVSLEQKVAELTNQERAKLGLKPLKWDASLSKVAKAKSADMLKNGYFDHDSPTYGSPFDMMDKFGIQYWAAGENIAMGYDTPASVVKGWMNSPGHRANILSDKYTHIGVGYEPNGSYWTQHFIGK